jgi:hypothetical protein
MPLSIESVSASPTLIRLFLNTANPFPLVVEHAAEEGFEHPRNS